MLCGIIESGEVDQALISWEIYCKEHELVAKNMSAYNHVSLAT